MTFKFVEIRDKGTFVPALAFRISQADHYLAAGLELMVAVDRPGTGGAQSYLMFVRQYRFDQMPKVLFVSLRGRVTSKLMERHYRWD